MASPSKTAPTSAPLSTSAASSHAMDVSAHRSCHRCARRMSGIKYTYIQSVYNVEMLGALSAVVGHQT